jgi:hypothetical protein
MKKTKIVVEVELENDDDCWGCIFLGAFCRDVLELRTGEEQDTTRPNKCKKYFKKDRK